MKKKIWNNTLFLPRRSSVTAVALLLWLLLTGPSLFAQLTVRPLGHLPVTSAPAHTSARVNQAARTQATVVTPPFFDDFSFTPVDNPADPDAGKPLNTLWMDSSQVWVNSGLAIRPPSQNVVTFDGLDSTGAPYSDQILSNGFRDGLTSRPIRMSTIDISKRTTVYLSFAFQCQGNGEAPDQNDYLRVEFKNVSGTWEVAADIFPLDTRSPDTFYDTLIQVNGSRFFHDGFQFRFRNYGRRSGPYDMWHLDYIYLDDNRNANDATAPDRTVMSRPGPLFGDYRAVPLPHFLNNPVLSTPTFLAQNLSQLRPLTAVFFSAGMTIANYVDGNRINTTHQAALDSSLQLVPVKDNLLRLKIPFEVNNFIAPNASLFRSDADSIFVKLAVSLNSSDNVKNTGPNTGDYDDRYIPLDFRVNDTTHTNYVLNNYYAYDDGIAEYSAVLTVSGNRAAQAFDVISSSPDTLGLTGFDIYIPPFSVATTFTADFTVYDDNAGVPGEALYTIPSVSLKKNALNTFQRIPIVEPFRVGERFYIGWKAPVSNQLHVGLDASFTGSNKIFANVSGSWEAVDDLKGALMIRPRFGSLNITTGIEETPAALSVYPNPNNGAFYINFMYDNLDIISSTGQSTPFQAQALGERTLITLSTPAAGLYLVRWSRNGQLYTRKLVVKGH